MRNFCLLELLSLSRGTFTFRADLKFSKEINFREEANVSIFKVSRI